MDKRKVVKHKKLVNETVTLPMKEGNGLLRYSISIDHKGNIARYSLTYINANLFTGDNCRVLGFDNCHGYHHCHYMGKEKEVDFISYEEITERFENEWRILHEKVKKQYKR